MEFRSQPLSDTAAFPLRRAATLLLLVAGLLLLGGRVAYLTIFRGEEFSEAAVDNLTAERRLEPPRGNIFDRNGRELAISRRAYSLTYSRYGRKRDVIHETLGKAGEIAGRDFLSREEEIATAKPSWRRLRLARNLPQRDVVAFLERPADFPGLRVEEDYAREYSCGPASGLVIGHLGRLEKSEAKRYPAPTYLGDSLVGRDGVERQYERELCGEPGVEHLRRDARGRALAEPLVEPAARAGDDIVLSLDAELQQVAYDALRGLRGSAVLMDVHTGELLVFCSVPAYDPARMEAGELDGQPVSYFHRAARGSYMPGSAFKMITSIAALRSGVDAGHRETCTGSVQLDGYTRPFYCDARSGHGALDLANALKASCNSYYYRVGLSIGPGAILDAARDFGLAEPTGLDFPAEARGSLPAADGMPSGETLNVAIGQGALVVSPVQVAAAYAALANGGDLLAPRLVRELRPSGGAAELPAPVVRRHIDIAEAHRRVVIEGLWRVVNARGGTALRAAFPPEWEVCGKTSTTENSREKVDAWFAGFYPRSNPRYAIAVMVEDADGHGGDVAAPIARRIVASQLGVATPTEESAELAAGVEFPVAPAPLAEVSPSR